MAKPARFQPARRAVFVAAVALMTSVSARNVIAASPAEDKLWRVLNEPAELSYVETPLEGIIEDIQDRYGIPVQLDERALEAAGVPKETVTTVSVKGVSLRAGLGLILRPLELTFCIRDEVVQITEPDRAAEILTMRAYSLDGIIDAEFPAAAALAAVKDLVIESDSDLTTVVIARDRLLVRASTQRHFDVQDVLETLKNTKPVKTKSDGKAGKAK